MTTETTSSTLTELIRREAYAAGALYYAEKPGLTNFVTTMDITGQQTLVGRFPIYDKVSAAAIAEATDFSTNSALDTSNSVDVTVSEHAIKFTLTRLMLGATVEDIWAPSESVATRSAQQAGIVGQAAAEALIRLRDQDMTALFSAFNSSTGSTNGAITTTLFEAARGTLDINSIPSDRRVAVLHPFQWNTLLPSWDDASVMGAQGAEIVRSGAIGSIYGVAVFVTANVETHTLTNACYAGAIMHADALASVSKGPIPTFEVESDASLRAIEVVATGVWGEAEYRGGATTSGVGGAGVLLYSNATI
jgi:hypothetical protein